MMYMAEVDQYMWMRQTDLSVMYLRLIDVYGVMDYGIFLRCINVYGWGGSLYMNEDQCMWIR